VRRPFYEIAAGGSAPIAAEALARIAELYAIEAEIRGRSADERRAVRQEKTRPRGRRPEDVDGSPARRCLAEKHDCRRLPLRAYTLVRLGDAHPFE
jgi:alkanesulfonate monooxygenase SsuD/methylene tetrahydromethanopterin reductase-like flavin-dependent oxidoreductase (luciferase family)